jgi:hypothetical protein
MFGKGIYFADLVPPKNTRQTTATKENPIGLLLLAEVALGNMYELKKAKYMDKPPKGTPPMHFFGLRCWGAVSFFNSFYCF